jgi:hypothetical protein
VSFARTSTLLLRLAVAGEFFGHGWLALSVKPSWIPLITALGFEVSTARLLMPAVGALDLVLAALVLVRPMRGPLLWMTFWGLFTALLRPLSGGSWVEFVERGANWGAPLALLSTLGWPRGWRELWR